MVELCVLCVNLNLEQASMENTAFFNEISGVHKIFEVCSVQLLARVNFMCAHLKTFQINSASKSVRRCCGTLV